MAQSSGTRSRVYSFSASRKAATASSRRAVPLSRSPSALSARAEIVLGHGPFERHALAGPVLTRDAAIALYRYQQLADSPRLLHTNEEPRRSKADTSGEPGLVLAHVRDDAFELLRCCPSSPSCEGGQLAYCLFNGTSFYIGGCPRPL